MDVESGRTLLLTYPHRLVETASGFRRRRLNGIETGEKMRVVQHRPKLFVAGSGCLFYEYKWRRKKMVRFQNVKDPCVAVVVFVVGRRGVFFFCQRLLKPIRKRINVANMLAAGFAQVLLVHLRYEEEGVDVQQQQQVSEDSHKGAKLISFLFKTNAALILHSSFRLMRKGGR